MRAISPQSSKPGSVASLVVFKRHELTALKRGQPLIHERLRPCQVVLLKFA